MMASPADLEDFALGFSLTEGIIGSPDEIEAIEVEDARRRHRHPDPAQGHRPTRASRRGGAGSPGRSAAGCAASSSIDEAMRSVDDGRQSTLTLSAGDITQSVKLLSKLQPLHAETGAVHAAGFYVPGKGIVAAREDVGRHNALDKLAGALAKAGVDGASGAVVVTSRVSVEMVQKTAAIGAPIIIAVSAPTALAIRTAEEAGMTLVALVRGDEFDIFTHPERVSTRSSQECRMTRHPDRQGQAGLHGQPDRRLLRGDAARRGVPQAWPSTSTTSGTRACAGSSSRSSKRAAAG